MHPVVQIHQDYPDMTISEIGEEVGLATTCVATLLTKHYKEQAAAERAERDAWRLRNMKTTTIRRELGDLQKF